MSTFDSVRQNADALHATLIESGADPLDPTGLVDAALEALDLDLYLLESDDPALKGSRALYDDQAGLILCENIGSPVDRAILIAHEIGHARLHAGSVSCTEDDINLEQSTETAPVGLQRVEDYGAQERRELQANVFARDFFLPRRYAKRLFIEENMTATTIAERTTLPLNLVRQQLFDSLLLPDPSPEPTDSSTVFVSSPDPKQDLAVNHSGAPFQLQAGPGTGKTRTLVKRIEKLVDDGVDPASILVLTFSNRAAGELSERLHLAVPEATHRIWIGTFHAFGLDVVRRHYDLLSVSNHPALFDRSDAISVLEEILPTLPLVHYRNLWDPSLVLRDIIGAISRAKDEMVGAVAYRKLASAMLERAASADDEAIKAAQKCLEIADVYDLYEEALRNHGGVDFGDIIMRPTQLLESNEAVRITAQLRHRHILVDEYQDVNRASARLLKAVAGNGERLWVVGDTRQSIYRFRGASSENMAVFASDYPGSKIDRLENNYRSTEKIIRTYSSLAHRMGASTGMLPLNLDAKFAAESTQPEVRSFASLEAESLGVAESISELHRQGVRFKDQAVLCRTHKRLNEIAFALEGQGIPVLHLGSLFEREEIRDLLSIISLLINPHGDALVRIAAMPRYAMSLQDTYRAISYLRETSDGKTCSPVEAVNAPDLTPQGKKSLELLATDLNGLDGTSSPWDALSSYLLDRTEFGRELGANDSVADQLRAVAVWQFLNFVRDQSPVGSGLPLQRLLDRVRQMVLLAEERDLRQVPDAALQLDAVRMMTVHGSKGLEFEAVHVPGLTVSSFPSNNRGQRCPPPEGMITELDGLSVKEVAKKAHTDEEECLFFVALSRAKTQLRLYRSKTLPSGSNRKASPFLSWLSQDVLIERDMPRSTTSSNAHPGLAQVSVTTSADYVLTQGRLESYDKCPRRFFYTHILGLGGARKSTAFSRTHDCLYDFLRWLANARTNGNPTLESAEIAFENIWQKRGPIDHAYVDEYRQLASRLIGSAVTSGATRQFRSAHHITVDLDGGRFHLQPDEVAELPDGRVAVRRVRTGYKRSNEYTRLEYALYVMAAQSEFGSKAIVEALHLTDDTVESVTLSNLKLNNSRSKASGMLNSITEGRFQPNQDAVVCPRCPHFFICAATPDGVLKIS